jgi:coiled-coil domain-containing protein 130
MSSLSAARADNFYQPPNFDPKKHKTLNKLHGTHRLGVRAKRIHEGILTIRFEMPYKVWCENCNSIIAKGVRFNAEKKPIGKFHSSTIWEFSMKCYWCPQIFVVKTDPELAEYICASGCRKKIETYEPEQIDGIKFRSEEELLAIERDPMLKLEVQREDNLRAEAKSNQLEELLELQSRWYNDAAENKAVRQKFREQKAEDKRRNKSNTFSLPLPPSDDELEDSMANWKAIRAITQRERPETGSARTRKEEYKKKLAVKLQRESRS